MPKPEWANKIQQLRELLPPINGKPISQGKFGRLFAGRKPSTNVSGVAVSMWERGVNEPSTANYIRMGNMSPPGLAGFFYRRAGIDMLAVERALSSERGRKAPTKRSQGSQTG